MAFYLKPKKYDLRYLLGMPLACEPLCTIGVVAQKVLTGVVNVLWVLVEAEFIDKAVRLVTGGTAAAACRHAFHRGMEAHGVQLRTYFDQTDRSQRRVSDELGGCEKKREAEI